MTDEPKSIKPMNTVQTNVRALYDQSGHRSVNGWAKELKLTQTTLDRIVKGKLDPSSTMVEKIAKAVGGLEGWQLMVPDFDPRSPPMLRKKSAVEHELYETLQRDFERLKNLHGR